MTHLTVPGVSEYTRNHSVGATLEAVIGNTEHADAYVVDSSYKKACDAIAVRGSTSEQGEVLLSSFLRFPN